MTMNRRQLLSAAGLIAGRGIAANSFLAPVQAVAADVKTVRIKNVEYFTIEIPATPTEVEAGVMNRVVVTRVVTESGVRGYSFGGPGGIGGVRRGAGGGGAAGARTGAASPA